MLVAIFFSWVHLPASNRTGSSISLKVKDSQSLSIEKEKGTQVYKDVNSFNIPLPVWLEVMQPGILG